MSEQLLDIPPSERGLHAALSPPSGMQSNFENPLDIGPSTIPVAIFITVLGLAFLTNRLYVKAFVTRKMSWDDVTCTLGFICSVLKTTGYIWGATKGPYGTHQWNVTVAALTQPSYTISSWLSVVWATPAQGFIKLSILAIFFQTFWVLRWMRVAVYLGMSVTTLFYSAATIATLVLATPRPGHQTWFEHALSFENSMANQIQLPITVIGVALNLYLLFLPVVAIVRLQLPMARKVRMGIVFLVGFSACVCSAESIRYRLGELESMDKTWTSLHVELMVITEVYMGLIVACMPQVSVMIIRHTTPLKRLGSYFSSLRSGKSRLQQDSSREEISSPGSVGRHQIGETKHIQIYVEKNSIDAISEESVV